MHRTDIYTQITKVEEQSDGSCLVYGIASTEDVDADGEVIKADSMRAVLPEFMKYGTGNLREMHQMSAVGIVTKAEVNAKGETHIEAKVVDPVAVAKVKSQTYKGFSIRGMAMQDSVNPKILTMQKMTEISLVDRPNNGRSLIHTVKIEDAKDVLDREKEAEEARNKVEIKKLEAAKAMDNKLKLALAALQDNVLVAQTLRGVEVLKSLVADENEWVGAEKDRRDIIDSCDSIMRVAKGLAPASLQHDIQKVLASSTSEGTQEVVKALTDAANVQKGELAKIVEAAKAYGLPDTTTTEQFIVHLSKRIADLSALPGAANIATRSVSKSADNGGKEGAATIKPVMLPGTNQEDKAATEIKKIHAAGGTPYDPIEIIG